MNTMTRHEIQHRKVPPPHMAEYTKYPTIVPIAPSYQHYFLALFLTSSSLHACNMTLFGCPGVMPECPFDQSYETAYAKMVPLRLKPVAEIGPGAGSKAYGISEFDVDTT